MWCNYESDGRKGESRCGTWDYQLIKDLCLCVSFLSPVAIAATPSSQMDLRSQWKKSKAKKEVTTKRWHKHTHTHTYTRTHTHTHMHSHMHSDCPTHIHVCMHARTHAHTSICTGITGYVVEDNYPVIHNFHPSYWQDSGIDSGAEVWHSHSWVRRTEGRTAETKGWVWKSLWQPQGMTVAFRSWRK